MDVWSQDGFDIRIGNPPYINIYNMIAEQRYFFNNSGYYSSTHLKYDIYVLFIERSLKLLRDFGEICFIIPSVFYAVPYASLIREIILTK